MSLPATVKWIGLALLGLVIAAAVAIAASNLASQQIGIASESIKAGDRLAPPLPAKTGGGNSSGGGGGRGPRHEATPPSEPTAPAEPTTPVEPTVPAQPTAPSEPPPSSEGGDHAGGDGGDD